MKKEISSTNKRHAIQKAFSQRKWAEVILLTQKELDKEPDNLWLLTTLQVAYLEKKEDKKAFPLAKKCYEIMPRNIWFTQNYAASLANEGQYFDAIRLYKKILRKSANTIASDEQVGNIYSAHVIKSECVFAIGECYECLKKWTLAIKWLQKYLSDYKSNCVNKDRRVEAQQRLKLIKNEQEKIKNISIIEKALLNEKNWVKANKMIIAELKKEPDDIWLLTRLSFSYYQLKKYKKALIAARRARKISPNDLLILWMYASSLEAVGRKEDAINIFKQIIKKGKNKISFGKNGQKIQWTYSLISDSMYRIGLCYEDLKKHYLAVNWIRMHIEQRAHGKKSEYSIKEVRKKLKCLQEKGAK